MHFEKVSQFVDIQRLTEGAVATTKTLSRSFFESNLCTIVECPKGRQIYCLTSNGHERNIKYIYLFIFFLIFFWFNNFINDNTRKTILTIEILLFVTRVAES